jgi:hypothetical protein
VVSQHASEQSTFTYEDFLALPDDERKRIDEEIDAMPAEELRALGQKVADFIYECDRVDLLLQGLDLE